MTVRLYVGPAYGIADDHELDEQFAAWRLNPQQPMPRGARSGEYLRTARGELVWLGDEDAVLPLAWLANEKATSVAGVIRAAYRHQTGLSRRAKLDSEWALRLTAAPSADYVDLLTTNCLDTAPTGAVQVVVDHAVAIRIWGLVPRSVGLDGAAITAIAAQHMPRGLTVSNVELEEGSSTDDLVTIDARVSPRSSLTLGQLDHAGEGQVKLLQVADMDAADAWSLLVGGRGDLLIGQHESDWLEVKSAAYRLDDPAQEIELAQDVARLANGGKAALLVCGYKTKRLAGGGEVISAIAPVPEDRSQPTRLRRCLDRKIYPPVPGLRVRYVPIEHAPGGLVAIYVPRQLPKLRPFLVHGAVVAGHVEGAFISIVARRHDDSVNITAAHIHALLAGELAQDPDDVNGATTVSPSNGPNTAVFPNLHPSRYADPLHVQPETAGLCLRAAIRCDLRGRASVHIEPRNRRKILTELAATSPEGPWEQPADAWQSTQRAVFTRPRQHGFEQVAISNDSSRGGGVIVADAVLFAAASTLSLQSLVDELARLIRRCASDLRSSTSGLVPGGLRGSEIEVHVEARGQHPSQGRWTIGDAVDLTPLGSGRQHSPTEGATVWPIAWATEGAEKALVLESLRAMTLDWGYLDPDDEFVKLGWLPPTEVK